MTKVIKSNPKPVFSFRLDQDLVRKVRASGIDITSVITASLEKTIKQKKCPTCGHTKSFNHSPG
jgi:post-segregation antitoxin (ccd killing protein)